VALADRNLVNADHLGTSLARSRKLDFHVLLVEGLDRMPVQPQIRRNVLDRRSFTLLSSRRTSNSRKIRVSPHDRSRTRQILRSYQPTCMLPQQPHAVFLTAD
jgi:hypothetical protein